MYHRKDGLNFHRNTLKFCQGVNSLSYGNFVGHQSKKAVNLFKPVLIYSTPYLCMCVCVFCVCKCVLCGIYSGHVKEFKGEKKDHAHQRWFPAFSERLSGLQIGYWCSGMLLSKYLNWADVCIIVINLLWLDIHAELKAFRGESVSLNWQCFVLYPQLPDWFKYYMQEQLRNLM